MRIAAVAAAGRQQLLERRPPAGAKSRPTTRTSGNASISGAITAANASSTTSAFTEASERMKTCSGTASRQLSGTSIAPSRAQA